MWAYQLNMDGLTMSRFKVPVPFALPSTWATLKTLEPFLLVIFTKFKQQNCFEAKCNTYGPSKWDCHNQNNISL